MSKNEESCIFCGETKSTFTFKGKSICLDCGLEIADKADGINYITEIKGGTKS